MKRLLALTLLVLLPGAALAGTPVERHGQLRLEGTRLVDQHGEPVTLRGMSLFWSQWAPQYYNADAVRWLKDDWAVTVVRAAVAVHHDGYLDNPEREMAKAETVIDAAIHRQWIACMGRRTALAHLAHLVCELYKRLEVVRLAADCTFELPLSQAVLADVLGLSTVHVNRLIAELRSGGVLTWAQGRVEILDWDKLAELAEFDPAFLRLRSEPV